MRRENLVRFIFTEYILNLPNRKQMIVKNKFFVVHLKQCTIYETPTGVKNLRAILKAKIR